MNKTIHELNSLAQAQADDELIIYDVSEGKSKKIQVQDLTNPNYSTTEQKTGGTWIDGKPIYRKVIRFTTSTDQNTTYSMPYVETIVTSVINTYDGTRVACFGIPIKTSGTIGQSDYVIRIDWSTNGSWSSSNGCIIFEYTKTTD